MSLFDNCPLPTELPDILKQICGTNFGQIQKIAMWQKGQTPFTGTTILTAAAWTTAMALTDDGKPIVSNYVTNFAIPNSTAVEQTADTNINAMPELQRGSIVKGTFMNRSITPAQITVMQSLTAFTQIQPGVTQLGFVMINEDNKAIWNDNAGDLLIDMFNFFTSDTDITGTLGALNNVASEFYLKYGWSKNLKVGQMAFDFLNTYPAA
jgi:hypothetical protein